MPIQPQATRPHRHRHTHARTELVLQVLLGDEVVNEAHQVLLHAPARDRLVPRQRVLRRDGGDGGHGRYRRRLLLVLLLLLLLLLSLLLLVVVVVVVVVVA